MFMKKPYMFSQTLGFYFCELMRQTHKRRKNKIPFLSFAPLSPALKMFKAQCVAEVSVVSMAIEFHFLIDRFSKMGKDFS